MKKDKALPPNAFLEPNNPLAVFPQTPKPEILDFRVHKMKYGGRTAVNTFRKVNSENAKKSKYATIVRTAAQIEAEEKAKAEQAEAMMEFEDEQQPEATQISSSKITIEDLAAMTDKLTIGKKKKTKK